VKVKFDFKVGDLVQGIFTKETFLIVSRAENTDTVWRAITSTGEIGFVVDNIQAWKILSYASR